MPEITKYKILTLLPVGAVLFLIVLFANGCNEQKVLQREMAKNNAIANTFTRKEIKGLASLRLVVDKVVFAQTGEHDPKKAYENYISYLTEKTNTVKEISSKIQLPHDSLVVAVNESAVFREIWNVDTLPDFYWLELNRSGRFVDFLSALSEENPHFTQVLEGIEIAGDFSPSTVADFFKRPQNYNMGSEAEKLYASVVLITMTNPTIPRFKFDRK